MPYKFYSYICIAIKKSVLTKNELKFAVKKKIQKIEIKKKLLLFKNHNKTEINLSAIKFLSYHR